MYRLCRRKLQLAACSVSFSLLVSLYSAMKPKFKFLSAEERVRVVVLSEEGYSSTQIAAKVGCNQSTVSRILQKKKVTGDTKDRPRSGRPRKSSYRQDRVLRRTSLSNRRLTSPQLLREWQDRCGVNVCPSTVRKRCCEFGLRGCKARKKPLVTAAQRKRRVDWAVKYSKWTKEIWEQVLFSDESTFCILGGQSSAYVRRFPGEEFKPECINVTVKHPTKVMIWGCMAAGGVGRLHVVAGMVNARKYTEILETVMVPSAQSCFLETTYFRMTMLHVIEPRLWLSGRKGTRSPLLNGQGNLQI
jgi:transposase